MAERPLPLSLAACRELFSLSEETEAAGEGDNEAPLAVVLPARRRPLGCGVAA